MTSTFGKGFFQAAAILSLMISAVFCATGFCEDPEPAVICDLAVCVVGCSGSAPACAVVCLKTPANKCSGCIGCFNIFGICNCNP